MSALIWSSALVCKSWLLLCVQKPLGPPGKSGRFHSYWYNFKQQRFLQSMILENKVSQWVQKWQSLKEGVAMTHWNSPGCPWGGNSVSCELHKLALFFQPDEWPGRFLLSWWGLIFTFSSRRWWWRVWSCRDTEGRARWARTKTVERSMRGR